MEINDKVSNWVMCGTKNLNVSFLFCFVFGLLTFSELISPLCPSVLAVYVIPPFLYAIMFSVKYSSGNTSKTSSLVQ